MLLFAFAKRITGSTLFAAITALFLTADGMHFVQSRIATPEGIVIFFATAAVYAFYRFWIASQVGERPHVDVPEWGFAAAASGSLVAGCIVALLMRTALGVRRTVDDRRYGYFTSGFYLLARYVLMPRFWGDDKHELTFAEGSRALVGDGIDAALRRRRRHDRRSRQDPARRALAKRKGHAGLPRRRFDDRVRARRERDLRNAGRRRDVREGYGHRRQRLGKRTLVEAVADSLYRGPRLPGKQQVVRRHGLRRELPRADRCSSCSATSGAAARFCGAIRAASGSTAP